MYTICLFFYELWFLPLLWGVCNTPCGLANLLDLLIWGPSLFLISFTGPMITNSVPTQSTNPIAILPSKQFKLNLTLTILQNPHQCKIWKFFGSKSQWLKKKFKFERNPKKNLQKLPKFLYVVQVGCKKNVRMILFYFFLPYFDNSQIWLSQLMDDHHLSYITKLKRKTLTKINVPFFFSALFGLSK
jgi:hypothetical protein